MTQNQPTSSSVPWFSLAIIAIFCFSLFLRFWDLGKFNTLVFDEVYYAKFANNYLIKTPFFNSHPPLTQYIIALGIWLANHFTFPPETMNAQTGYLISTWSYRWVNALTGSFIPVVVGLVAYQLIPRVSFGIIAALFAALDGIFLVESRYALNNIYFNFFGLLTHLFFLQALNQPKKRIFLLTLSGIFSGATVSVKWNGLGFILGIYLYWAIAWLIKLIQDKKNNSTTVLATPLAYISQLKIFHLLIFYLITPLLTYRLLWIPHLLLNPEIGFWQLHKEILNFHQSIGVGADVHPYCSPWYSWPLMWRPIAYYYEVNGALIYDVHALGNPLLWWLSTAAILLLFIFLLILFFGRDRAAYFPTATTSLVLYLISNWVANLLPWMKVSRCIFLYHYMASYTFAWLALSLLIDRWLQSKIYWERQAGITLIIFIILAFIFLLPIYLGLPLSPEGYKIRMLFSNWI